MNSFKGSLTSCATKTSQKLQQYINDFQNLNFNLGLLFSGDLQQNKDSKEERNYYFNKIEYRSNPDEKSKELESYDKGWTYYVRGKPATYRQTYDMKTWVDVTAN